MKKWVCPVCGYVHEGEVAPAECPVCHVAGEKFFEQAAERVKTQLALEAIRDAEGIAADDAEVDEEIAKLADSRKKSVEEIKATFREGDMEYFKQVATMNKVVAFLKTCVK